MESFLAITEISEATSVSRRILSEILNNKREEDRTAETPDKIGKYFGCRIDEFGEYMPHEKAPQ